jgi:prepilin-type N-terminal cleavage/methylation domain-containing protein
MYMKEALRKKAKGKKGFTLVELVIVIAVLAIIAAIAIPTVSNVIKNANESADASNAQSIEMAIKTAQSECAAYNTNHSDKVVSMGLASDNKLATEGTPVALSKLLNTYGVSEKIISEPKVANDKFYYDATTGKVAASTTGKDSAEKSLGTELTANSSFKLGADGSLTLG